MYKPSYSWCYGNTKQYASKNCKQKPLQKKQINRKDNGINVRKGKGHEVSGRGKRRGGGGGKIQTILFPRAHCTSKFN